MKSKAAVGIIGVVAIAIGWFIFSGREPVTDRGAESSDGSVADANAQRPAVGKRDVMRQERANDGGSHDGMGENIARLSEQRRADHDGWAAQPQAGRRANAKRDTAMAPAEGAGEQSSHQRSAMGGRHPAQDGEGESAALTEEDRAEFDMLKETSLNDADPKKRMDALESLETFDDEMVMPVLVQALNDRDAEIRLSALQELASYDDDEVPFDTFANAMYDSDPEVRLEALRIVGDSEDTRAQSLVRAALNDPNEDVREEAEDIIDLASD